MIAVAVALSFSLNQDTVTMLMPLSKMGWARVKTQLDAKKIQKLFEPVKAKSLHHPPIIMKKGAHLKTLTGCIFANIYEVTKVIGK